MLVIGTKPNQPSIQRNKRNVKNQAGIRKSFSSSSEFRNDDVLPYRKFFVHKFGFKFSSNGYLNFFYRVRGLPSKTDVKF